jgi:hypothetical protein
VGGEPVTIGSLLRRIEAGRTELDRLLAEAAPVSANGWSPKDHMAHIACWEHSALELIAGEPRYAHLGISAEQYRSMDTDEINAHIFEKFRNTPADQVARYYADVHGQLIARLRAMSDDDLLRPYSHYQPNDPPVNEKPVWPWIEGNTVEHYQEHASLLQTG